MDLNRVMLIGRITNDLEVKKIGTTDSSVVNFTIATNRKYKNRDGNSVEEAEFHRCVAFGNLADILGKYVGRGSKLYLEGRLRTRKWEDTNGNTKYTTEVITENFLFLDAKGSSVENSQKDTQKKEIEEEMKEAEEDLPF